MARSLRIPLALVVLFAGNAPKSAAQDVKPNLGEGAKFVAKSAVEEFKTRLPDAGKDRVAVLLFGDQNRKYPKPMGNLGPQLQGAIIEALKDELTTAMVGTVGLGTKFSVPLYETMVETFQNSSSDVGGLSDSNIATARTKLAEFNFQVGIVGHFEFNGETASPTTLGQSVSLSVTVVFRNDAKTFTVKLAASDVLLHILNSPNGPGISPGQNNSQPAKLSSRFDVKIMALPKNSQVFEEIPLRVVTDSASPLFNKLVMFVDSDRFKGQPYEIQVTNRGTGGVTKEPVAAPGQPEPPVKDKDRVFLLATYVDGVSVIKKRVVGTNNVVQFVKDVSYYPFAQKYIITGTGRQFEITKGQSNDRFTDAKLTPVTGAGNSLLPIKGFLKVADNNSQSVSGQFLFGDEKTSVGQEFIGAGVSQIGVISLYFFAEKLPGDPAIPVNYNATIGTVEGDDIPTPVITLGVKNVKKVPVETWHIVYRYKTNSDPTSVPVTPVTNPMP